MPLRIADILDLLKRVLRWDKILPTLYFAAIPGFLFFSAALYILKGQGFESMQVLTDPAQLSGASSFLGFLSNIGIWMWVSAMAINFFTVLTRTDYSIWRHRELLVLLGIFSAILAVDDFFMLHDRYINQWLCYAAYVVVAAALFIRHSEGIVQINGFAFLLALGLLGASIGTDAFQGFLHNFPGVIPIEYSVTQIFEEGCKFIGAASWLYFTVLAARPAQPSTALNVAGVTDS